MAEKIKLAIIDTDEGVRDAAMDAAAAELSANKNELKGVKGYFKKLWKHNLAAEYYRQREIAKAKKNIVDSGNMYITEGGSIDEHNEAMGAIVERFVSEYDEMIDEEAGENRRSLHDGAQGDADFKQKIVGLVTDYASGSLDRTGFDAHKKEIFEGEQKLRGGVLAKSDMYADNLLKVAENIKQRIEHGEKMADLQLDFDVVVGKAKAGVRTEAQRNVVDKIVEKVTNMRIGKFKFGNFVFEGTTALAIAGAWSLASAVGKKVGNSKVAQFGTLGLTSVIAGLNAQTKEHNRLKNDRRQHNREMAQGKEIEPGAKRRLEMENFLHETVPASELVERLKKFTDPATVIDEESFKEGMQTIAEIEARKRLSAEHKIDLISFSDITKVEQERRDMVIAVVNARRRLTSAHESNQNLVTDENASFTSHLRNLKESYINELAKGDGGIIEKNKEFNRFANKKAAWAGVKGMAVGLAFGTAGQEFFAYFREHQQGIVEGVFGKDAVTKSVTAFEGLRRWFTGTAKPRLDGPLQDHIINGGNIRTPEGSTLVPGPESNYSLLRGGEPIADHITLKPDGSLTDQGRDMLKGSGIIVHEETVKVTVPGEVVGERVVGESTTETSIVSPEEYVEQQKTLFHEVDRDGWMDNNTEASDKNELKLHWGGANGTGMDPAGNYVFNVKHMTAGGSFHGGEHINAQELMKSGSLKMAFSLSGETQQLICEVPIDANGNAIIDKTSQIGKIMFSEENGKAKFLGKLAEVVQSVGVDGNGVEKLRVLSTHVGEGMSEVPLTKTVPGAETIIERTLPPMEILKPLTTLDVPAEDLPIDLPIVLPLLQRTPLERAHRREKDEEDEETKNPDPSAPALQAPIPVIAGAAPLAISGTEPEQLPKKEPEKETEKEPEKEPETVKPAAGKKRQLPWFGEVLTDQTLVNEALFRNRRSPTLNENPQAFLDQYTESERYINSWDKAYLHDIENLSVQAPEMAETTRLAICIPAGYGEGKSIYRSLENYTNQTADPEDFEINVLYNHADKDKDGKPVLYDDTFKEVKRFIKNHPKLKVNLMYSVLPLDQAHAGRARKLVTDATMYRNFKRGKEAPELILVSNDADTEGVAPEYVDTFVSSFRRNPESDAQLGQLDWDPAAYLKYPGIHVGTRLYQYLSLENRKDTGYVPSSGANFAIRSSSYAAVGGYMDDIAGKTDANLGEALVFARQSQEAIKTAPASQTRLYTSARSLIEAWNRGIAPADKIKNGLRRDADSFIRSYDLDKDPTKIDFKNAYHLDQLRRDIQQVISETLNAYATDKGFGKDSPRYVTAINRLGIRYTVNEDRAVTVTDMSRLVEDLKRYQKKGISIRNQKTGKGRLQFFKKLIGWN